MPDYNLSYFYVFVFFAVGAFVVGALMTVSRIIAPRRPTPEKLRKIPLNRIHAAVTMRGAGVVQLALAMRFKEEPTPDMFTNAVLTEVYKGGSVPA